MPDVLVAVLTCYVDIVFFFFFQAEDGIRDRNVTGVQTCALPISRTADTSAAVSWIELFPQRWCPPFARRRRGSRSEERRVGKECRSRWAPDHEKKKEQKTIMKRTY